MPHQHYRPSNNYKKPKRGPIRRFFRVLKRIFKPYFKAFGRLILKQTGGWKGLIKWAAIGGLALVLLGFITIAGTLAYFSRDLPDPDKLIDRQIAQSTKIYDRTGETLLYEIAGDKKRTIIKLEDLPEDVPEALIALEDKTFYEHSGFRYRRVVKAVLYRLAGRRGPGASTLTSQLVKNAILTPERTISRKLKEFILTYQIERKFTKDQILQLYLNEIPYGSRAYGIEAAANFYFDKGATELNLAESALLASIIQRPTYYSPYGSNRDALLERKDLALHLMHDEGFITEEERDAAKEFELTFKERREDITAPHFVFHVREQLTEIYGEHMVNEGGLIVRTSLDLEKQEMAEEILKERAEGNLEYNASNAALVSIDPKTGEVLSMVGSVDYFNDEIDGNVNVTTRPRQPGSSFKPIAYTLGWQRGYTPSTILFDVETDFPSTQGPYHPRNYDLGQKGPINLRKALQGSLNIPAVKMLYLLGVENILDFAEKLGYTTFEDRSRFGLSLVLGGGEVTLLEHTAAFATFANDGVYRKPLTILDVKTTDGHLLDEFEGKDKGRQVLDQNIARITSNVLADNEARAYAFGLNSPLTLGSRPAAAKTGTTNDYRDAWTMGYTPNLATGVWVGNNDFSEMSRGAAGGVVAAPIWQSYMRQALEGSEVEYFTAPEIPAPEKAVLSGKSFGLQKVEIDKASGKLATDLTPPSFRVEKLFVDAHSILHYVDKSNPTGPAPGNPAAADPQYTKWEEAIQAWLGATIEKGESIFENVDDQEIPKGIELVYGPPPAETDDLHVEQNRPRVSFISPSNNTELTSRFITAETTASAPRSISRVEYYIDDVLLGSYATAPYTLSASLKGFPNGFYNLRAVAYDDIDNSRETTIRIEIQSEESYVKTTWDGPSSDAEIKEGENVALRVNIDSQEVLNQVTFFAVDRRTGQEELVSALISPGIGLLEVIWTPAKAGDYRLYVKISVEGSGVLAGPSRNVVVSKPEPEEVVE